MSTRYEQAREIVRATHPRRQRGLAILVALSVIVLVGLSVSGVWQFFTHQPDPTWFDYTPGRDFSAEPVPATGMRLTHGFFGTAAGILALFGGAWLVFRIAHRVPLAVVVVFAIVLFGALTEALVRFNVVKVEGQELDATATGYTQVFSGDVEYVATDAGELGGATFVFLVIAHIATVPVLVGVAWWSIRRAVDRRVAEIANAPERSWSSFLNTRQAGRAGSG